MSARKVIEAALMKATHKPFGTASVYEALTTKGYRLLKPGELDPDTIERCAEIAEADTRSPMARHYNHHPGWYIHALKIAKAIRALKDRAGSLDTEG